MGDWRDLDEPAFPYPVTVLPSGKVEMSTGMSLRDWFAGKALEGLLAGRGATHSHSYEGRACDAYRYADAMLKAREN
jgi:hypothetical protein